MESEDVTRFGIKALEVYIPSCYVDQTKLEAHDGVSAGKYTIGLGQAKMSICNDREDPYSMALTCVTNLFRKYKVDPTNIGRLEVGTETVIDKSKSIKTVLMQLFESVGNHDIEGVDNINACYGGTNALFNSLNWLSSAFWDARDALVVAVDIAVYEKGPARPTGGAGCVAMLLGSNAPLRFESIRSTYMEHAYDFYKANLISEYPLVDGKLSLHCYANAMKAAYLGYRRKIMARSGLPYQGKVSLPRKDSAIGSPAGTPLTTRAPSPISKSDENTLTIDWFDYFVFHSPTSKTVFKSYAQMLKEDFYLNPSHDSFITLTDNQKEMLKTAESGSRDAQSLFEKLVSERFTSRVSPGLSLARMCGNMYTASLYGGLCSLLSGIEKPVGKLLGRRVGLFSYGSGLAASMFSLRVSSTPETLTALENIAENIDLATKLNDRTEVSPEEYESMIASREAAFSKSNYVPTGDTSKLRKGTWYLKEIDCAYRRIYAIQE